MDATGCPAKEATKYVEKYLEMSRSPLFRNDVESNAIHNKWYSFIDKLDRDTWAEMWDKAYATWKQMDDLTKKEFATDVKSIANRIAKDMEVNGKASWFSASVASELKNMWRYDKETIDNIAYLEDVFRKWGYAPYKAFQTVNENMWIIDIYQNTIGSMRYAFALQDGVNPLELKEYLLNYGKSKWMAEWMAERFKDDMLNAPLLAKEWSKRIGSMKSMYSFLKFSPLTGLVNGSLLLANNTVMWINLLLSKRRWLENLMRSEAVDYLVDTEKFLASESRADNITKAWVDQDWKNFFNRYMDKVFSVFPNTEWWAKLRTFFQGWVHQVRDMGAENTGRRLAITEALSKNGINQSNMGLFLENLKAGKISPEFLIQLRWDAGQQWKQFFTTWQITSLNRNRFSKWRFANTLQGYVINRADDVWTWVRKWYLDWKSGKLKTRGDFADYLQDNNPELKNILNNVLMAAKMWVYINAMTDGKDGQDSKQSLRKYVTSMSDYLSSLNTTFFYQVLTAPVEWLQKYYKYTEATWQSESFLEWVNTAWLNTLSTAASQMFREWKILNILSDTAIGYLKTGDVDLAKAIASTDLDKIVNGMGRYSLLPGYEAYGLKWVDQPSDMISRVLYAFPEFNQAAEQSQRLKDIWQVEWMINDTGRAYLNLFTYMPVLQSLYKGWDRSITWQYSEAAWKLLQKEIETNPTMQKIWNGEFPTEILKNEDITNKLYSELLSHSYYGRTIWEWGEHVVDQYGTQLSQTEEKVFVQNILEHTPGLTPQMMEGILRWDAKQAYLVKAMAAADAAQPGASKIILGYLANEDIYQRKLQIYGKGFSNAMVTPEVKNQLQAEMVAKYYPYMQFADKASWYKLAREYISDYKPEIFSNLKSDPKMTGFVNTLGFQDMVYWNEAQKWDVDAQYVKNIFNISAKYIKNPELRTKLVTNWLETISELDNATQSQKQLMRLGLLTANIDHYATIKKDPVASITYADDINKFENTMRWVLDNLNKVWIHGIEEQMTSWSKSQYYGSTWKKYVPSSYSSWNNQVKRQFQEAVNKNYNPAFQGRDASLPRQAATQTMTSGMHIADPKVYSLYVKTYDDTYKAVSDNLTQQWVKQYPSQYIEGLKFSLPAYRKSRNYKSSTTVIPKWKKQYTPKWVKTNLPGG